MDCSGSSYVPNNPQFGLQFECNWTPGSGSNNSFPVPASCPSPTNNCYQQTTYSNCNPSTSPCTASGQTFCCNVQTDDLSSCWSSEDMGSLTLPLELDPLPSLFPFSPCSTTVNSSNNNNNNSPSSTSPLTNGISYK